MLRNTDDIFFSPTFELNLAKADVDVGSQRYSTAHYLSVCEIMHCFSSNGNLI